MRVQMLTCIVLGLNQAFFNVLDSSRDMLIKFTNFIYKLKSIVGMIMLSTARTCLENLLVFQLFMEHKKGRGRNNLQNVRS